MGFYIGNFQFIEYNGPAMYQAFQKLPRISLPHFRQENFTFDRSTYCNENEAVRLSIPTLTRKRHNNRHRRRGKQRETKHHRHPQKQNFIDTSALAQCICVYCWTETGDRLFMHVNIGTILNWENLFKTFKNRKNIKIKLFGGLGGNNSEVSRKILQRIMQSLINYCAKYKNSNITIESQLCMDRCQITANDIKQFIATYFYFKLHFASIDYDLPFNTEINFDEPFPDKEVEIPQYLNMDIETILTKITARLENFPNIFSRKNEPLAKTLLNDLAEILFTKNTYEVYSSHDRNNSSGGSYLNCCAINISTGSLFIVHSLQRRADPLSTAYLLDQINVNKGEREAFIHDYSDTRMTVRRFSDRFLWACELHASKWQSLSESLNKVTNQEKPLTFQQKNTHLVDMIIILNDFGIDIASASPDNCGHLLMKLVKVLQYYSKNEKMFLNMQGKRPNMAELSTKFKSFPQPLRTLLNSQNMLAMMPKPAPAASTSKLRRRKSKSKSNTKKTYAGLRSGFFNDAPKKKLLRDAIEELDQEYYDNQAIHKSRDCCPCSCALF